MGGKKRNPTSTSQFGTTGRISHDASRFYGSRLYEGLSVPLQKDESVSRPSLPDAIDRLYCKSSESMIELPDESVHLMITSPPYNVTKEYDTDLTLAEYRDFLRRVFREVLRVLVVGGRACVNVANLGRKPYIPLHAYIAQDMIDLGLSMRGEIIWNKGTSAGPSTAWGSWKSASNPTLRDVHEYVLVFSKGEFSRNGVQGGSTISRDEFLEYTKSVWSFPTESARRVGHPAPFPVELPRRLIQLYSFTGDLILDPFAGSGTTCIAAVQTGRHYVGYETRPDYVEIALRRIHESRDLRSGTNPPD
ncbi:MAG: site-specific DNA-methyltransferase [Ignavibacteriales bacterium]|nr:site-specific DNA-methyltransferase [Ignavibacteriales bacterium]